MLVRRRVATVVRIENLRERRATEVHAGLEVLPVDTHVFEVSACQRRRVVRVSSREAQARCQKAQARERIGHGRENVEALVLEQLAPGGSRERCRLRVEREENRRAENLARARAQLHARQDLPHRNTLTEGRVVAIEQDTEAVLVERSRDRARCSLGAPRGPVVVFLKLLLEIEAAEKIDARDRFELPGKSLVRERVDGELLRVRLRVPNQERVDLTSRAGAFDVAVFE